MDSDISAFPNWDPNYSIAMLAVLLGSGSEGTSVKLQITFIFNQNRMNASCLLNVKKKKKPRGRHSLFNAIKGS